MVALCMKSISRIRNQWRVNMRSLQVTSVEGMNAKMKVSPISPKMTAK